MVLSFKERFVGPIQSGIKIHTIRDDKSDRWRAGHKIHGATGVRTKKYHQFFEGTCKGTQQISIRYPSEYINDIQIRVDGKLLTLDEQVKLALNDGFACFVEFSQWFKKDFDGKIIHWTDFRY